MDFGKVAINEISSIDYQLPADPELTKEVLKSSSSKKVKAFIGCAKWGRKEWVGQIYPPKTKEANFLDEYTKHFNSIELNATFYQIYSKETIAKWAAKVSDQNPDFVFCPKISRPISHLKRLKNAASETTEFLENISAFGKYLGPVFLQLSDNFGPKNMETLKTYLEDFPKDVELFVEVRHKDWFAEKQSSDLLFNTLKELNIGSIITDASGRRDCVHMHLSTPKAFIRFVGNSLHPTDYKRLDDWINRIKQWQDNGLKEIYFFIHQHDEKDSPQLADYAVKQFNKILDLDIKRPQFVENGTLF